MIWAKEKNRLRYNWITTVYKQKKKKKKKSKGYLKECLSSRNIIQLQTDP